MSEQEFYANATLGFRQWHFSPGAQRGKPPALEGMMKYDFKQPNHPWDLKGLNRAECLHLKLKPDSFSEDEHGPVPGTGCSCGFYAHGRRDGSNSETLVHMVGVHMVGVHMVGGVVAGWGDLELHERGFRCGVAKILAVFAPNSHKSYAEYHGADPKQWTTLMEMCEDNSIPILSPDALRDDEAVRLYAYERDLAPVEEQLGFSRL